MKKILISLIVGCILGTGLVAEETKKDSIDRFTKCMDLGNKFYVKIMDLEVKLNKETENYIPAISPKTEITLNKDKMKIKRYYEKEDSSLVFIEKEYTSFNCL